MGVEVGIGVGAALLEKRVEIEGLRQGRAGRDLGGQCVLLLRDTSFASFREGSCVVRIGAVEDVEVVDVELRLTPW